MSTWSVGQRAVVNGEPCTWRSPVYKTDGPEVWVTDTGHIVTKDVESVYPLWTGDPNNADQMDALYQAWWSSSDNGAPRLADAIRSMLPAPVLPPAPTPAPAPTTPEPNGRGAYIEGPGCRQYTRDGGDDPQWFDFADELYVFWSDIAKPVTVHFHGVGCACAGPGCTGRRAA